MSSHRLFCNMNTLSEVIRLRKDRPYSSVFSVIEKLSDIYLESIDKTQIIKLASLNPIINKLLKRVNRKIIPGKEIKTEISSFKADDIYLMLPPESSKFVDYRDFYGILITKSLTDLEYLGKLCQMTLRPFNLLTEKQKTQLTKHNEEFEDISSWEDVFKGINIEPINSAVIMDNYLFNNFEGRKLSVYSIIKNLVPTKLKIPFHLTMFIYNDGNLKKEKMEQVIKEIHELKLGSPIKVSIIAHTIKDETHDRYILTNYHLINSGRGFGIFDFRNVKHNAKGQISSTFQDIDFLPSFNSFKHQHSQLIDLLKDIYIDRKGMESVYAFEVGDDFNNRLLED